MELHQSEARQSGSRHWLQFMHCAYLLSVSRCFGRRFRVRVQGSELGEVGREQE